MCFNKIAIAFITFTIAVTTLFAQQNTKSGVLPRAVLATGMPDAYQPVKRLKSAVIGQQGIYGVRSFAPEDVLRRLFPAKYYLHDHYNYGKGRSGVVVWENRDMPARRIEGWFTGERFIFPYRGKGNMTEAGDTIMFTDDNGIRNIIFSFGTHENGTIEDMHMGRFFCVVVGLAWFEQRDGDWYLKAFDPGLGCYGAYQTVPAIKLVKLGKNNYGCYWENHNGGPGQVHYTDIYMAAMVDGHVKLVFHDDAVRRSETPSSYWDYRLSSLKQHTDSLFEPITEVIKGRYYKTTFDTTYDWTDAPVEFNKTMKAKDSLNFRVTRKFIFDGKRYKKALGRVKITP